MHTCELFLKSVSGSLIAICEKAITAKIKKSYFETGDIVLVIENLWPLGHFLEVKPNKREGVTTRENQVRGPQTSHRQDRSSRGS